MAQQYVFVMKDLRKVVPPKRQIIKDISLSFFPGAKIGLLGLNGSGKSTVLRIMAGQDAEFDGELSHESGIRIGYLPQKINFFNPHFPVCCAFFPFQQPLICIFL
jgi:sulfate-transporting ATPase